MNNMSDDESMVDIAKNECNESNTLLEQAMSYMETKENGYKSCKDRESIAEKEMIAAKENLRNLSINVLPNIEEETSEDALPLPSSVEVGEWVERRTESIIENHREEKTKTSTTNTSDCTLSKEQLEYDQRWEEDMKKMVVDIATEDKELSKWAERAAKISSKPQMVLKSDGSVKSLH